MSDRVPAARRARPPERYGDAPRPLRRALFRAGLAALVAASVGFLGWVALAAADRPVRADVVGFGSATPSSLRVRVALVKPRDATATCRVVVRDATARAVGAAEVGAGPAAGERTVVTVVVSSSALPVTAEVGGCRER